MAAPLGQPSESKRSSLLSRIMPRRKRGGHLDPLTSLEHIFAKVFDSTEVQEKLNALFQEVRILVLGRSGGGKSTLIRLVVGDEGPQSISNGTAGEQDIEKEWRNPDPSVPLAIHDSNGVDVKGQKRLDDVRSFLDKMEGIGKPVHLVWYVISGLDRRFLDDGDLLELVSSKRIPLLLVITHNDYKSVVQDIITDDKLEKLLEGVEDKEIVKKRIVRVGNRVSIINNKVIPEQVDANALKLLSRRTSELMARHLRRTWMAAQVTDMEYKLDASAKLIVNCKRKLVFSSVVDVIPLAGQAKVLIMFVTIFKALCKIWRVPPNFRKALYKRIASKEGTKGVFQDLLGSLLTTVRITGALVSGGLALLVRKGKTNARTSMSIVVCYSSVILGCILYVKSIQVAKDRQWDEEKTVKEYGELCDTFAGSEYEHSLGKLVQESHSTWDLIVQKKKQKDKIRGAIVKCFKQLTLGRAGSLYSLMINDDAEAVHTNTQVPSNDPDQHGVDQSSPSFDQDQHGVQSSRSYNNSSSHDTSSDDGEEEDDNDDD